MVACDIEFYVGIILLKVFYDIVNSLLQITHSCTVLLYDGKRNAVLSIMAQHILARHSLFLNVAEIPQLKESPVMVDIDISHIISIKHLTVEMHFITVYAIGYTKG